MKLFAYVFIFLGLQSNCWALDPQVLSGEFRSNGEIELAEYHLWEKGDWATPEGTARRKELSNQGYNCIRRNPKQFVCHLVSVNTPLPEDVKLYVQDYLKNFSIEFVGPFEEPKEMINTSTEREWWIEGAIVINKSKVRGFKWTHQFEPHKDLVVLPVSEEQPIPWFIYKSQELLHLPLQLQQKASPNVNKVFRLEAKFVKR